MTVRGIGDVTTQDIGAALSQAGTILNPGTYSTTWNGGVLYTPAAGANVPGGLPGVNAPGMSMLSSMSPTTLLLIGGVVLFALSKGKK